MRILIVTEYFPSQHEPAITGGVEARAWFLSRYLAASHHVAVLTSWRHGLPRHERIDGVEVYRSGPHHPYSNENQVLTRLMFAAAAAAQGDQLGPFDIVDGYNFISYLPAYRIARRISAKAAATYHEVWCGQWIENKGLLVGGLGELWERLALHRRWDQFVAVSQFTADRLVDRGISKSKISIIRNGVDFELIDRIQCGPRKPKSICMVSRLVEGKSPELLLQALNILQQSHYQLMNAFTVKICGEGPLLNHCRELADRLNLTHRVQFLGRLESLQDVYRLMKESSLLVHPSKMEGFGIVVAEAAACGTPVLVADIPPSRELLEIVGGGRLFHPDSAHRLAQEIVAHFEQTEIIKGNSEMLRWEAIGKEVIHLYDRLLEQ